MIQPGDRVWVNTNTMGTAIYWSGPHTVKAVGTFSADVEREANALGLDGWETTKLVSRHPLSHISTVDPREPS